MTVANSIRHQSWAEVTSDINRIASLPAEARSEAEDQEEQTKREPFIGLHDGQHHHTHYCYKSYLWDTVIARVL